MPKRVTPEQQRHRHMRHRYGLEPDEYEWMFTNQDNRCACCGKVGGTIKGSKLVVDHDHVTRTVRKLLCNRCNYIAGAIEDYRFISVFDYLKEYGSNALARLELILKERNA